MNSVLQIGQIRNFKIQVKNFYLKWRFPSFYTELAVAGFSLILERTKISISVFKYSCFQRDINKKKPELLKIIL